jgi:photosystem II stability/assembly factor-like uncharacterized protein
MSDEQDRELLEQERRRFRMGDDSYRQLERRRDRKRRNRMITSGVLALVIAAAGGTGVVLAFRNTGTEAPSATTPPPTTTAPTPTPTSSPTVTIPSQVPGIPVSSAIQFIDAQHGWWVSPNGEIMAQIGGGAPVTQYQGPKKVVSVQFVGPDNGWALTTDGLLRTSDGGDHWTFLQGPATPLSTVQFVTMTTGFGITPAPGGAPLGHLLHTLDGGETWRQLSTPELVESMCFVPQSNTSWVVAGATVYRSTDDTNTWTATHLDVPADEPWTATVRCASDSEAWVLLTDGGAAGHLPYALFHTSDGTTWQPVLQEAGTSPLGQQAGVYASQDPYPGAFTVSGPKSAGFVAWCPACNSVSLLRTTDGGTSWNRLEVAGQDKGGDPTGASFVDPDHGWVLFTAQTDAGPKTAVAIIAGSEVTISVL